MSNNFIFPNDPLLMNKDLSLEDSIKQLDIYKKALEAQQNPKVGQPTTTVFDDIEKEFASLTDEQRSYLVRQEEFVECQKEVDNVTQLVLANMLRPYILQTPEAKDAVIKQLDTIKMLKKRVIKEANKQQELFKEYTEKYSKMSWDEFIALKTQDINKVRAQA